MKYMHHTSASELDLTRAYEQTFFNCYAKEIPYPFSVVYLNGNEETFHCNGFVEAIVKAMAHAYDMAWDTRIKYIANERGDTVIEITPPRFKHLN